MYVYIVGMPAIYIVGMHGYRGYFSVMHVMYLVGMGTVCIVGMDTHTVYVVVMRAMYAVCIEVMHAR